MNNETRVKRIKFIDNRLFEAYRNLAFGKYEEKELKKSLDLAIGKLRGNPLYGINIPRKYWPNYYLHSFGVTNLRKINLPNAWRLVYTVVGNELEVVSIILEWFDHKEYSRRFGYKRD